MLPLERLLRTSWNSGVFLRGATDPTKPFLVADDGSRAHLERLNSLMVSDFHWALIQTINLLAREAELIGSWCEGCPCHPPPPPRRAAAVTHSTERLDPNGMSIVTTGDPDVVSDNPIRRAFRRKRRRNTTQAERESLRCCFRCCRAPELAVGSALIYQRQCASTNQSCFNNTVATIPSHERGELISYWTNASSKLFGTITAIDKSSMIQSNHQWSFPVFSVYLFLQSSF